MSSSTNPNHKPGHPDYDAHKARVLQTRQKLNHVSRIDAVNNGKSWTKEEDDIVLDKSYTEAERAELLGRTYLSVATRAGKLNQPGYVPDYSLDQGPRIDEDYGKQVPLAERGIPLCACGTIDGDHDDWCPSNV